jgi:putative ABC transport system permease protein
MLTDLRFALRQLWKNPGFTAVAVLALALGIGANTAIFSVVNAVLLKPLPFPAPEQVVAVGAIDTRESAKATELDSMSYPDFFDFREQNKSFAFLAVYRDRSFALVDEREAQSVRGQSVSAEMFDVLGVKPVLGRNFARADEAAGGGPGGLKIILGHAFWEREFKSDPQALGKSLILDRLPYTVIGVMPAGFQFPIQTESIDLYATIATEASVADGGKPNTEQRGNHMIRGVGRLKPGVAAATANQELRTIASALEKQYPDSNSHFSAGTLPLREELVGDLRPALYVLFGAVLCVLLIACANVANLLLARASVRGKEMALRAALGASRGRIVRQLLTESLLLAGLGGILGLLIANWGTTALIAIVPANIPRASTIQLDGMVLAFTFMVALATGVAFGLAPALQASRVDLNGSLKAGARGTVGGGRSHILRNGLVVAEVSLALVLLIGAGLLIQSFSKLSQVRPGVVTDKLLTARISLPDAAYPKNEKVAAFFDELLPRLRALPSARSSRCH